MEGATFLDGGRLKQGGQLRQRSSLFLIKEDINCDRKGEVRGRFFWTAARRKRTSSPMAQAREVACPADGKEARPTVGKQTQPRSLFGQQRTQECGYFFASLVPAAETAKCWAELPFKARKGASPVRQPPRMRLFESLGLFFLLWDRPVRPRKKASRYGKRQAGIWWRFSGYWRVQKRRGAQTFLEGSKINYLRQPNNTCDNFAQRVLPGATSI